MTAALDDVVVLELSTGVAGPYTGKLLADLGAMVVKVEPAGGDPARHEPPMAGDESVFFNWLNANKLGAVAEPSSPEVVALARNADIVLHSLRGPEADALDAVLKAANPAAVILSFTPYGRSGPMADWHASPLSEWATSGFHYIAGDPKREPIALPGFQAEFHAGLHGGTAALAGLWHARNTGQGQVVEISHQEATLSDHCWLTTSWSHQGKVQMRTGSIFAPCADGFVFLFNLVPYPNLFILMERFDLLEDEDLMSPLNWMTRFTGEVLPAFTEWAATKTKQEVYHACQELRIAASPVNTMKDVAENLQLAAREWFNDTRADGLMFRSPGFPYKLSDTPCAWRTQAPGLGEHQAVVFAANVVRPNRHVEYGDAPVIPGMPPLTGLRVIEVTANWAGPSGGRLLADLGADVIKIELATKPATRTLMWVPEDLWPDHYNRSGYFAKLNRNKRDICLDLSTATGKDLFLRLVKLSDVVLENNAARVMGNLGLDYNVLKAVNPGIVMCSMSGFGATGPERNYSAYGSNIESASGLASLLGYGPGEFFGTGSFYADPVTGNHGAVAILAALHHRRKSGCGQWIDESLLEAVTPFFAQQLLEYSVTGLVPEAKGNNAWGNPLEGVVPTAGLDCWLAVTIRDERDAACLDAVTGNAGGLTGSWQALAAWALERDHQRAAMALQTVGLAAAPVLKNWEILADNHLNDRDFFVRPRHPVMGTLPYPGWPWRFEATPAVMRKAAPLFAESNDAVFAELLGLSEVEQAALYATGVSRREPEFAAGSL